ncbi:MAG: hypothetical protein PHF55_06300 [Bacteroidales bacterium]|jgi:hypothetical protein|nr:hypothetical protein [Bacteroidales bacterium]
MKKIIIFTIILFLLESCNNKNNKNSTYNDNENITSSFILNNDIIKIFNRYVSYMNFDSTVIYFIEFYVKDKTFNYKDTFVRISYNYCDRDIEGYKGILMIDSKIVAICDKNNIGQKFYNKKYIFYVPYKKFECRDDTLISMNLLKLVNGKFIEPWGINM